MERDGQCCPKGRPTNPGANEREARQGTWPAVCVGLQQADSVVEGHGLDVEAAEDRLLVHQVAVVIAGVACRQDDTHVTHVDVDCTQVCTVQRRALHMHAQCLHHMQGLHPGALNSAQGHHCNLFVIF